jgi:Ca-activated chloride channel family protein
MDVQTDRELIRAAGKSRRYLLVRLRAPEPVQVTKRPPVNVAIVLDRSGSMHGAKLQLSKEATHKTLGLLGRHDRFSLVVYDEQIDVLVESTPRRPRASISRAGSTRSGSREHRPGHRLLGL